VPEHELLKRIGGGGFGEVWLARNRVTEARRAVKVVYRDGFEGARPYERELRGIKRFEPVSRTHPGLVDILQVGEDKEQGFFYYVMELADDAASGLSEQCESEEEGGGETEKRGSGVGEPELGGSIATSPVLPLSPLPLFSPASYEPRTLAADLKQRGRLSAAECIEVGRALAEAVAHLHRQGLLHRDIKPSNVVFLGGQPKLADLGLVATVDEASSFIGTRGFIPPEGHVSARSDLYSLGKVLYQCAWGQDRLEFPAIPAEAADWEDHHALLELNEVILKACDHDAQQRYASAEELQADLLLLRQGRSLRGVRRLERRLRHWARVGVAVSVVAVLALGGWLYQHRQSGRVRQLAEEHRRSRAQSDVAIGARLLEDGNYLESLPWLVEALRLERGDAAREQIHRCRVAAVLRQCPKLVAMGVHARRILYAEFSRDGRRLVTASADGTARVWDVATSQPVTPPLRHPGPVGMTVFSPDGTKVATCSDDGTARVWDAATGNPVTEPLRHQAKVTHIAFSEDNQRILTGSRDKTGRLWDALSGKPIGNALVHQERVYMVGFSPDGKSMATASYDNTARVWNGTNAEPVSPPLVHPYRVAHTAFSPDGRWLATACHDRMVRLWDTRTWQPVTLPAKHSGGARYVAFSPDGRFLASTGGETVPKLGVQISGEVMLWRVATAELLLPPMRHAETAYEVMFTPDSRWLVSASSDATVRLWDTETGASVGTLIRQGDSVRNAALSPDGRLVLTSGLDGVWRVWELAGPLALSRQVIYLNGTDIYAQFSPDGNRVLTRSAGDGTTVWSVSSRSPPKALFQSALSIGPSCFSLDGRWIAVTATNDVVRVLDTWTGEPVSPPMPHNERVARLTSSRDGRWLAVLGGQRTARVWEARTGRALTPVLEHRYPPQDDAFSPDGRYFAVGCGDPDGVGRGEVCVWSVATGQPAIPPFAVEGASEQVAFSPDSRQLVSACSGNTTDARPVAIVDLTSGGRTVRALPHPNGVLAVAYSPDGRRIATGCNDGRARVWEAASGRMLAQTAPHLQGAGIVTFNFDASLLATASLDGRARVWDAATGAPAGPWLRHEGHVRHVEFSADGNRLLTASGSPSSLGRAQLWELTGVSRPVEALERLAMVVSGERLEGSLNLMPLDAATLEALWRQLRSDWPEWVSTSSESAIAWHDARAADAEHRQQWAAARFHLARLAGLQPANTTLAKRLRRATNSGSSLAPDH